MFTDNVIMKVSSPARRYSFDYKDDSYVFDLKNDTVTDSLFVVYRNGVIFFQVVLVHSSVEQEERQLEDCLTDYLEEFCGITR